MTLLDFGCGRGSLTGWPSQRYPASRIVAVSNSRLQRKFIESLRLPNVRALTADANALELDERFDRILSVEMLEHMRKYEALFARIASWLEPSGRFFRHVFSHDRYAYPYDDGWIARRFFTGGTMPSDDLLPQFDRDLALEWHWRRLGTALTRALRRRGSSGCMPIGSLSNGWSDAAGLRTGASFFLACAELCGYRGGTEWLVSHYRFGKRALGA